MTSKIKVNILADGGDNSIITSDGAGSFTASSSLASSVQSVGGLNNTPAFEAFHNPAQTPPSNTWTKITLTNETFDTDNAFDTTNSKFTVPSGQAGTYVFTLDAGGYDSGTGLDIFRLAIYKNGSGVKINTCLDTNASSLQTAMFSINAVLDLAVGDYIEAYINANFSGTFTTLANASGTQTRFSGYKLIGA
jgi:hypothetical protein